MKYHVIFERKHGEVVVTQAFNAEKEKNIVTEEVSQIQDTCQHFTWNQSERLSQRIGEQLLTILNGENQFFMNALKEADEHGEPLQLFIQKERYNYDLPFELLCDSEFLVPFKVHVIHYVSGRRHKKVEPENRPLRVLFVACSPDGLFPVLDFEKEEEKILEITEDLPLDVDVEDTGSLKGLAELLKRNKYDVIHIAGHADIDKEGVPFFWMEDEEGYPVQVAPSELWHALKLNPPRLLFLSGCRTGETPRHEAAISFAQQLVLRHNSTVLGWGLPVSDTEAVIAAVTLYSELSAGKSILDAVFSARQNLFKHFKNKRPTCPGWPLLRLFSDFRSLNVPLVKEGQRVGSKARDIHYTSLLGSQVRVLKKGFVGRRRQIQKGIKSLKKDKEKVGLLLHGTGGLGKSCLAGKLCERFKDHSLVIVHGELSEFAFFEAVKDAFIRKEDNKGLEVLQEQLEIPDKIKRLCSTVFQEGKYLIVLDDFEKNIEGHEQGSPVVSTKATILKDLLLYLPLSLKRTQLIITSRYTFPLTVGGRDLAKERLEWIGLTSFRGADEKKKISELGHIREYPDILVRKRLIEKGCGNPRLMEALNALVAVEKDVDIGTLLEKSEGKQEEFVQELVSREILKSQPPNFQKVIQYSAVYRLPVLKRGIKQVCKGVQGWESFEERGVQLSLIEESKDRITYYWVTPLLREEIFKELEESERKMCHKAAVKHYREVLSEGYAPMYALELIDHALKCGMDDIAIEEGGELLSYLRNNLLYKEALFEGVHILSQISEQKEDEKFSRFLFLFGWILDEMGYSRKVIKYYERVLNIDREIYGEKHPDVATDFSHLGLAWADLGDFKKAVEYLEKALNIDREIYGEKHFDVAARFNNLGTVWYDLGDFRKAAEYYEKAFNIGREIYGEKHPDVATMLNNLGSAWADLGDFKKAIEYYEKALNIGREIYGEKHPDVAIRLNNVGTVWYALGDFREAVEYFEEALNIDREIYGEKHLSVATDFSNLGSAWADLGDFRKAIEYYEKALKIDREIYGEKHLSVAARLSNLGTAWYGLEDFKKAVEYFEEALNIDREIYGQKHPDVAARLNNLGIVWYDLRDFKKAVVYMQEAYSIFQDVYGDEHPYTRGAKEALDMLKDKHE